MANNVGAGFPDPHNGLPQRKTIRLDNYDYSRPGWYYVTICTQDRRELFGTIVGATRGSPVTRGSSPAHMVLNKYGKIVANVWETLPNHHPVELDAFQIMPNHIHFIIVLTGGSRPQTGGSRPQTGGSRPQTGGSRPAPTTTTTTTTLGTIVGLFKSECTKQIQRVTGNPNMVVWQRNYYEHIIRTDQDLNKIRKYIKNNPQMWDRDRNNPKNL